MKKLLGLIILIIFAALIWFGKQSSQPDYTVVTSKIGEENVAEKYSLDLEYPSFLSDSQKFQFINADIHELIATTSLQFHENAKDYAQYIKDNNLEAEGLTQGSSLVIGYEVATGTTGVLPVKIVIEEYNAGAAHPNHITVTRNYDISMQKILSLADLFAQNVDYLAVIAKYSKRALEKKFEADQVPTDPEWLATGTEPKAENYEAWLAEADGLHIIFNEYQVVAYAYGVPEIVIPWNELQKIKK
ncbi:MAG: RsiV family protein [Candidatus Paceibacterota bacterium]|jgi:hypothetical protein